MSAPQTLPHWDMTVVFPGLDSTEFVHAFEAFGRDIGALDAVFGELGVEQREPAPVTEDTMQAVERVIGRYNVVLASAQTLGAYINAFVTTDSRDTLAQARQSELQQQTVRLAQLGTRFTAWIGSLDVETLVERSSVARDHAYLLRKAKAQAAHLMPPPEEALAIELSLSSGVAWAKLHGNVSSQLGVSVEQQAASGDLPMSVVRNLAYDANREVRRRAYEAELAAWQRAAVPLAAALNSIKGEVNTLSRRRGWQTPLDAALFDANIDRQTLDAMFEAAHESFPDFRRYLRAKARALGLPALAWYDLFAPMGGGGRAWSFDAAREFIVQQFGSYSPKMAAFAARAFQERWIDAEPRAGKRDGAFCMALRADESRVLSNFKPSYGGMSTLAHELGHGYHNTNLARRTMLQRATPMTLAETASIFCETIVRQAALRDAGHQEQIEILEASLQGSCQVVVDITSRFLFEQAVFERRRRRELSIDEFNELMLDAQRRTYGDGLDQSLLHPYMWAVKNHYYSTGRSYYNFPYMFGLLFGLGLYARFQADPDVFRAGYDELPSFSFVPKYDELLSRTGMADPATLAAEFGIDIRSPEFWRSSLDIVRADVDKFESLVASDAGGSSRNP